MQGLEHELFINDHIHLQNEATEVVFIGDAHCSIAR